MPFDSAILERHGITPDEYARIQQLMGREPTLTELGMFSVMWSEHCSYKSSRVYLRTLPTTGPRVVQGPGENAGAVDIGDGLAAVFKIESHNHPSFIEPYQGAATGVGGIIRDIFTMGARPIASLNALRFGPLDNPQTRRIFEGVVAGIGGYGNSIGIPTIGGEIAFDESYAQNPLVNVLCLGIAEHTGIIKGRAEGVGNPVYYVGAKTGRDGIHGATMASATFEEDSADQRPAVQVGDPFMEKLLLEACLEVIKSDALIGIQDMGAAGLTCSTCEMAARGGMGIDIDVARVPQRETGMSAYEILLSESQERMLLVIKRGREHEVEAIFDRYDLHAVEVGTVTDDGLVRVRDHGTVVAEIPTSALTDEAPVYNRPTRRADYIDAAQRLDAADLAATTPSPALTPARALQTLLASPTIASKRWVYRQFDTTVRTNTLLLAGRGTPAIRVKGTNRALAMSVDANGRFVYLDPKRGAMLAVAEAARNVACAGAVPIGATNNLNFGNPQRPEIMWQFAQAVEGMAEACRFFEIPITGGNVSLYNETEGRPILPTPVIGIVGLIEDQTCVLGRVFPAGVHDIILLGENHGEMGGTEYLKTIHGLTRGMPPNVDLARERALQQLLPALAAHRLIQSAQDVSDGGLAVAIAECCFDTGGQGCDVDLPAASADAPGSDAAGSGVALFSPAIATLFGESAGQVIVSAASGKRDDVLARAKAAGVPARVIGRTGGHAIAMRVDGTPAIDIAVRDAEETWGTSIARKLARPVAAAV
jgi:phosphoribosylformylglycinamidine synthase II